MVTVRVSKADKAGKGNGEAGACEGDSRTVLCKNERSWKSRDRAVSGELRAASCVVGGGRCFGWREGWMLALQER